ncbi:uncharacterized protein Dwil_GK14643 [Drosophila willistoni]|uniref:Uncharacterized protein n=2 Tax=Drosophila willistoni TaxID=7260 RepID=B4MVC5_DROWI|nr:uncharacterized protein Dwil_GK14643 [Drosophila willistoni]
MDDLPPRQRSHSPMANGPIEQQHSHSHSRSPPSVGIGLHHLHDSSDNERPLSSNQLTATPHSASQSLGSISAGSPSPGMREHTPLASGQGPPSSPSNSRNTDSPIEVGGPMSLTTGSRMAPSSNNSASSTPTPTTPLGAAGSGAGQLPSHTAAAAAAFGSHIFGSFGAGTSVSDR